MKSLVIFGAQNDLVSFISHIDYADACNNLRGLVRDGFFDKIYFYEIDIYDPDAIFANRRQYKVCQAGTPGAAINWRAVEIGSELKLEKITYLNNIKNIHCTLSAETWMEMPYVKDFDTSDEIYLAGNLAIISKTAPLWSQAKDLKLIPNGVWLGKHDWSLVLSFEYRDIDFYKDDPQNLSIYRKKYLEQYYSSLPLADLN